MKRLIILVAVIAALAVPSYAFSDLLKVSDHGTTCSVVTVADGGQAVNCIGKLSGLGSATTTINVSAGFTCTNKAGNTVVGQSAGSSGPIQPQNGQVTFNVTTGSTSTSKCESADGHVATFAPCATIDVFQGGPTPVFTECVPISQ
jgi:hypothetical protein